MEAGECPDSKGSGGCGGGVLQAERVMQIDHELGASGAPQASWEDGEPRPAPVSMC